MNASGPLKDTVSTIASTNANNSTSRKAKPSEKGMFQRRNICYRCGYPPHGKDNRFCPGKNAKCHKCGRVGHLAKVCQSSLNKSEKVNCVVKDEQLSESDMIQDFQDMIVTVTDDDVVTGDPSDCVDPYV